MGKISKEDLFREIGEIDEAYVEEAERVRRARRTAPWLTKTLAAAASLAICVGVGYGALQLMDIGEGSSSDSASNIAGGIQMESAREECAMAEDAEYEEMPPGEAEIMAEQEAAAEEQNGSLSAGEETVGIGGEQDLVESLRQDGETGLDQDEMAENTPVQELQQDMDTMQSGKWADALNWEEARGDAAYGKYVDIQVPEGYFYTSGTRSASGLHVIWNKGMEEISVSCRQADESVSDWLVDVDCPEEYDLSLYPIPWCDSVPEELYSKVMYATFVPEQITPEIVAARTYQVQEAGDASGYRTQIGILYSDNVLVEIISKGPSPEEIYALINLE